MASLLFAGGILAYDKVQESRAKKAAQKAHNHARFSALEADNAARMRTLQEKTCSCDRSGQGCAMHPALLPAYEAIGEHGEEGGRKARREDTMAAAGEMDVVDGEQRQRSRRTDSFATTGDTENELLDGYASGGHGGGREEEEGPLVVPDVRGVMPRSRDEPCKRTLKERVLRRKKEGGEGKGDGVVR